MSLLALTANAYAKSSQYFEAGPGHLFMYTLGRFRPVRAFMVWCYSLRTSKAAVVEGGARVAARDTSLASTVDVDAFVGKIFQDGISTGLTLRQEVVDDLVSYAFGATCYGEGKKENAFQYPDTTGVAQSYRLGRYTQAVAASPALQALASDPQLLAITRKYLRSDPVLVCARMWWSLAGPADQAQQKQAGQGFHYDIDGYRGLTFFFYLTNVGPSSGPHVYVRGTHKTKALKHLVSLHKAQNDAEIEARYGKDKQVSLFGSKGSGFAEDIFGYHKGVHPDEDRLIVQVRFGLHDYGTGRAD